MTSLLARTAIVATGAAVIVILLLACGSKPKHGPTPDLTPDHRSFGSWRAEATTKAFNDQARTDAVATAKAEGAPIGTPVLSWKDAQAVALQTAESGGECNTRYLNCHIVRRNQLADELRDYVPVFNRVIGRYNDLYDRGYRFEKPRTTLIFASSQEDFKRKADDVRGMQRLENVRMSNWMYEVIELCHRVRNHHQEFVDALDRKMRESWHAAPSYAQNAKILNRIKRGLVRIELDCSPESHRPAFVDYFDEFAEWYAIDKVDLPEFPTGDWPSKNWVIEYVEFKW